jgi:hypothetical protein
MGSRHVPETEFQQPNPPLEQKVSLAMVLNSESPSQVEVGKPCYDFKLVLFPRFLSSITENPLCASYSATCFHTSNLVTQLPVQGFKELLQSCLHSFKPNFRGRQVLTKYFKRTLKWAREEGSELVSGHIQITKRVRAMQGVGSGLYRE